MRVKTEEVAEPSLTSDPELPAEAANTVMRAKKHNAQPPTHGHAGHQMRAAETRAGKRVDVSERSGPTHQKDGANSQLQQAESKDLPPC